MRKILLVTALTVCIWRTLSTCGWCDPLLPDSMHIPAYPGAGFRCRAEIHLFPSRNAISPSYLFVEFGVKKPDTAYLKVLSAHTLSPGREFNAAEPGVGDVLILSGKEAYTYRANSMKTTVVSLDDSLRADTTVRWRSMAGNGVSLFALQYLLPTLRSFLLLTETENLSVRKIDRVEGELPATAPDRFLLEIVPKRQRENWYGQSIAKYVMVFERRREIPLAATAYDTNGKEVVTIHYGDFALSPQGQWVPLKVDIIRMKRAVRLEQTVPIEDSDVRRTIGRAAAEVSVTVELPSTREVRRFRLHENGAVLPASVEEFDEDGKLLRAVHYNGYDFGGWEQLPQEPKDLLLHLASGRLPVPRK